MTDKTNVMRILDGKNISYKSYSYEDKTITNGEKVAEVLGLDPRQMFKTLVTEGRSGENYVFLLPVAEELDLKKGARAVGEKSIAMIRSKDLVGLTGYVHGGCSPIGMKRKLATIIERSAEEFESIIFNAGKIGYQLEVDLEDLEDLIDFKLKEII